MIKHFFCTKCGAPIEADDSREFIFCTRCGSRETVNGSPAPSFSAAPPAPPQINRPANSGETPNLIINFTSIRPDVNMLIKIPETNLIYPANGVVSIPFLMTPGNHTLFLKIGKRNYSRMVYTYHSGAPVIVNCAWDGRARIDIDQPFMGMDNRPYYPQPPIPPQYVTQQNQYAQPQQQYPPQQSQYAQPQQQYAPQQNQYAQPQQQYAPQQNQHAQPQQQYPPQQEQFVQPQQQYAPQQNQHAQPQQQYPPQQEQFAQPEPITQQEQISQTAADFTDNPPTQELIPPQD